ncbi:hypothetical protein INR49_022404 [Caranx melampygus]|nr:hypothetical protein INR49_022404 [Caranx melampygus]
MGAHTTGHLEITKKTHEASHPMNKKTVSKQPTKRYVNPERDLQSKESESEQTSTSKQRRPENILQESLKSNKKNDVCVREQTNALKDSWAARQSLFCPSPPFIDKMRSAERSAPTLDLICSPLLTLRESPLPASPDPACQDTPSPSLLLPKPRSTGSNEGNFKPSSLYSAEKKPSSSKPQSVHSVPSLSSLRDKSSSAVSISSTPISFVSVSTPKTPPSDRESSSQLDASGPSRKRHISSTSNSDEDEKEERKKSKMRRDHSPRMKPRKLFKSFTEVLAAGEVSEVMSPTHTVTSGDMDEDLEFPECVLNHSNMCQQFSTDLKKKIQNRYQMMEDHNKQSLMAVQQHVSSLNIQVTKYRTQRLSQIQKVLMGEINKLEQDDTALKRMEKDLTIHWKEQTVAFRSYWEQQTMRDETLKKALQTDLCHSLQYENKIFTSQMCLVRKDMKSVQDRLLCEMQEREIQSVKSGLYSLFFPDGARF